MKKINNENDEGKRTGQMDGMNKVEDKDELRRSFTMINLGL